MAIAEPSRPTPEQFLNLIRRQARGRLKVYLGSAAGVGKTYAMLREGQRLKKQGVDVVIGIVETHDRAETQEQIGDLEIVPPRIIEYRGVKLREMDLDAILAGAPRTEIAGVMTPSPYKQGGADPSRVGGWIQARRAVEKSGEGYRSK